FPRWNPLLLGGTPFLESLAGGDSLYPTSLLLLFMDTHRALGWKLVLHVFLAGLFMFAWVRALGLSRVAALLAGLAFLMAPYMVTLVWPGHDGKLFVTALTPLLFWAAERSLTRRGVGSFAVLGLIVALILYSTHFQMAYFLFGGVGAYYVFRTIQIARGSDGEADAAAPGTARTLALRKLTLFLLAALLGAGAAGIQLVPAVSYITDFSRRAATTAAPGEESRAYSSSWSMHPEEAASLVVPEFVGSNIGGSDWTSDTYWGRNPFKHNHEYAGLIVLLLAGISFAGAPRRGLRWFFTGLGGVALLFTLGANTPVWRVFYEILPGISLFRAPSMVIFLFGFSAATLMAFGVDRAFEVARDHAMGEEWRKISRYQWGAAALLLVLLLLAASGALTSLWTALFYRGIEPERAATLEAARPFIVRGSFFATVIAAATAGIWWALRRGYLQPLGVVVLLALAIGTDQGRVNEPFIQLQNFREFASPDENMRFLMARTETDPPFRVFSVIQNGQDVAPAMHGVELAAGHHPNDLLRYRELIGGVGGVFPENLFNANVLAILNVRYLLWPDYQFAAPEGLEPVSRISYRDGRPFTSVYPVPTLPRARLVADAVVLPDAEVLSFILGPDFDPAGQVVLPEAPPIELSGGGVDGAVVWEERGPNALSLRVRSEQPALLVLSDNWFPAWRARLNGEEVPVLRANYTLRAVAVPAGDHALEFFYRSHVLRNSLILTLLSLGVLLGAWGYGLLVERRAVRGARSAHREGG
ncbi:MAG: hypothetical protein WDZ89_01315, partial [Gemmatimonadota bacterium]